MRRFWAVVMFLAVAGVGAVSGWVIEDRLRVRDDVSARARVHAMADGVRLRLESRVSANMQIAEGLAGFVAAHPTLTAGDFSSLAASLLRHRSEVRSIGLARDTTIVATHPLEGNEAILGVDYRDVPEQWPSVRKVRDEGRPMVAGPVSLIQGGQAIIGRVPIFLDERNGGAGAGETFWGLTSIPIDMDALFAHVGLTPSLPLVVALRGRDGLGAEGEVFFGQESTFTQDEPELLTIYLPGGTWEMAAIPVGGWPGDRVSVGVVFAAFLFGGLMLGAGAGFLTFYALGQGDFGGGGGGEGGRTIVLAERAAFVDHLRAEVADRQAHGRGLALLAFDLPEETAARLPIPDWLRTCRTVLRDGDALGVLGRGRFCVLLSGAGEDGATVNAGLIREAMEGRGLDSAGTRFAGLAVGAADGDGIATLARVEALLDHAAPPPGGPAPLGL